MEIKTFIEKAIEGGWRGVDFNGREDRKQNYIDGIEGRLELMVLDKSFWEAVGKVEGWFIEESEEFIPNIEWQQKMHQMIDHLIEGGTLEEYINSLK